MMKTALATAGLAGLLLFAVQARGGPDSGTASNGERHATGPNLSWNDWALGFRAQPAGAATSPRDEQVAAPEIDVVDAHWMALTMWGEARGSGEDGMRAVGHVIANRRAIGRHGDFVTETVSEAWQFSCWNAGDPNLEAIRNVDRMSRSSHDFRMWDSARRIAAEILAGRSEDPTGGALFYHADYVSPRWSRGVAPVARIGDHLFYQSAR